MILSYSRRFLFLAVPKTGTHAVRFALRAHMAPGDDEQVQMFLRKARPYPDIAHLVHGHVRWDQIRAVLTDEIWTGYFKFAFVRNPWERFVSYCAFAHRETGLFAADPRATMARVLANPEHRNRVVFRPQHEFICNSDGVSMVDYVGRHEAMQQSYDAICARLDLPATTLERINTSIHGPWRDYYTTELREGVAREYARDIDTFCYRFDS